MTLPNIVQEPGSFRDPSGSVFYFEGAVYRGIDEPTFALMQKLHDQGLLRQLADDGLIVGTELVEPGGDRARQLRAAFPGSRNFLAHATVPFVSYPYEWTVSMLADAAILHLDLQARLLKHGYSLKDATAFNVAFVGAKPVFLDLPSIEVPRRYDVWVAYGQFCRMFVFPILLQRYRGLNFKQCFLGELEGPAVAVTRRALGLWKSLLPAALVDVFFQNILNAAAEQRSAKKLSLEGGRNSEDGRMRADGGTASRAEAARHATSAAPSALRPPPATAAAGDPRVQAINLTRLRQKIIKLSRHASTRSAWSGYEQTHSYDSGGEEEKIAFVKTCLQAQPPRTVLDLGCNTGRYARLAAEAGASVIAVDGDPDCIDILYQRVRRENIDVLPLCMDLTNPSPALGFRHRERKSFEARADFDGVMALALVHHLLVSARVPLLDIRDLFASLTRKWLIVEYVAIQDPMFRQLLTTREDYYQDLTPEVFETVFKTRFSVERKNVIMNGRRVLYLFHKSME